MTTRTKSKSPVRKIKKPSRRLSCNTEIVPHPSVPTLRKANKPAGNVLVLPQQSCLDKSSQDSTRQALRNFHPDLLGDLAYIGVCESMFLSGELLDAAVHCGVSFQKQMAPKDALERLALMQALMAHARAAWLAKLTTAQTSPQSVAIVSEATDRASSTFVRLMRAIGEYRKPTSASTFVSVQQANVAQQQVVQNVHKREKHQIKKDDKRTRISQHAAASTPTLPAHAKRNVLLAGGHSSNAAVDKEHWTKDRQRKVARPHECIPTRSALKHRYRAAKTGERDR
ncbi:MAG: hypothetical protein WA755_00240 [Candidatus Acidiferrales bacterium]